MTDSYEDTLVWCIAALVLKMMINHMLVVRVRMAGRLENKYGEFQTTPEAHPSQWYGKFMFPIFYYALLGFAGPYRTMNDMERFQCMERNATENETYFMAMALAWPKISGGVPDWAPTALLVYTYSRFAHFVLYSFLRIQPWRAIAWTVGVVINMVIAVSILRGASQSIGGEL